MFSITFEEPKAFLLLIPIILVLLLLIRRQFVRVQEDETARRRRKALRGIVTITRLAIAALVVTAIAAPIIEREAVLERAPVIRLLADNSTSMALFEPVTDKLQAALDGKIGVERVTAGAGDRSNLGDVILGNLGPRKQILVVSDGQVTNGAALGDVALLAAQLNATISAVKLTPVARDVRVTIEGPAKVLAGVESTFVITVTKVGTAAPARVRLLVDDREVAGQEIDQHLVFRRAFTEGAHKLEAVIDEPDAFANNRFLKAVKAVQKPNVLFLTEHDSPLTGVLGPVADLTVTNALPRGNLSTYSAIVLDDIPAPRLDDDMDRIISFVTEGNGLFVIGGHTSFDRGGYQASPLETLLPAYVGTAGRNEGEVNVALVIDISSSTGSGGNGSKAVDIEKALAVNVLHQLRQDAHVATIAFHTKAFVIGEPKRLYEQKDLEDKIARLKDGGGTIIAVGLAEAIKQIKNLPGSKSIVLISDGFTGAATVAHDLILQGIKDGIKTYTIGVGAKTNTQLMREFAVAGGGTYFEASDANRIRLILGDIDKPTGKEQPELVVIDRNHFITAAAGEPKAKLSGWNPVVPRSTARLLAVTTAGDPLLVAWQFGLGRVVTLATDDGSVWASQMLGGDASTLLVRSLNWAVGDPERTSPFAVNVQDTRVNEPVEVSIRSATPPNSGGIDFVRTGENTYTATLTPAEQGFIPVGNALVAVNYPREADTGDTSSALEAMVLATGGRFFTADQADDIATFTRQQLRAPSPIRQDVQGPLALAVIGIFLIEILMRRILRNTMT